ncbi:MAG TPA: hypothetical protein VJX29_05915 [Candidatus Acidoferrales bacterium]|nr:hypothetical protein [Candidatus Acidoferrales bacterium]
MEPGPSLRDSSAPTAAGWRAAILLAAGVATLAILPIIFLGNVSGHDVEFHLPNWIDVARHWHEGVLYPHWSGGGHFGFGDPRFIIYPPLSWLVGGLLAALLPGAMLPGAYVWICVAANALGAWRLAREWFSPRGSLFAAAFYATNPYLVLVYSQRCAYSELLASSFFPIALLFALRLGRSGRAGMRAALCLAPAFACMWICNVPAAVLASYGLGFVLLWLAIGERSLRPLLRGAAGMALGLGLAAFYILPIALEMKWTQGQDAFAYGLSLWNNFLFHRSEDADHTAFNLLVSALACGEMALAGVAFPVALRRMRGADGQPDEALRSGLPVLCTLAALYAVMLFPWSAPVWRILPRIWMAEFPWRSLYILNLALAMALVAALRSAKGRAVWASLAAVVWLGAGGAILAGAPWDPDEIHEMIAAANSPEGFEGVVDEFLPAGVDPDNLEADAPRFVAVDESGEPQDVSGLKFTGVLWNAEEKRFTVESGATARIRLHLLNYPTWRATVNGARVPLQTDSGTGQMVIAVPAGRSEVRIWFGHTRDRTAGPAVSLGALAVFILLLRRMPAPSVA